MSRLCIILWLKSHRTSTGLSQWDPDVAPGSRRIVEVLVFRGLIRNRESAPGRCAVDVAACLRRGSLTPHVGNGVSTARSVERDGIEHNGVEYYA